MQQWTEQSPDLRVAYYILVERERLPTIKQIPNYIISGNDKSYIKKEIGTGIRELQSSRKTSNEWAQSRVRSETLEMETEEETRKGN